MGGTAMTLRLSEEETEALHRRAAAEGKSMHEVVRLAVVAYVSDREQRLDAILDRIVVEDAELLRRLGS